MERFLEFELEVGQLVTAKRTLFISKLPDSHIAVVEMGRFTVHLYNAINRKSTIVGFTNKPVTSTNTMEYITMAILAYYKWFDPNGDMTLAEHLSHVFAEMDI